MEKQKQEEGKEREEEEVNEEEEEEEETIGRERGRRIGEEETKRDKGWKRWQRRKNEL